MADTNYLDRKLVARDYFGRPLDLQAIKEEKEAKHFGVFNTAKALSDTSGPLVSMHSSRAAADKAAKENHHYKVLELKKPLEKGCHANTLIDVIPSNTGLFTK
jgi:hypothetical protein